MATQDELSAKLLQAGMKLPSLSKDPIAELRAAEAAGKKPTPAAEGNELELVQDAIALTGRIRKLSAGALTGDRLAAAKDLKVILELAAKGLPS